MSSANSSLFQLQAARLRTRAILPDLGHSAFSDVKLAEDIPIEFSLYPSARETTDGERWCGSLKALADYLTVQGKLTIKDKKLAPTMTQAVSGDGCRKDASCAKVTLLFCDADGVGDWDLLLAYLDSIKAGYVAHRSSSHDKENGLIKWHLFLPITAPLVPKGERWKQEVYEPQYGWIVGVLSEMGRLHEVTDCHPKDRKWGLDHSTSDLIQPAFVGRRLKQTAPDREVRYSPNGGTLNWDRFLEATGYYEARLAQAAAEAEAIAALPAPPPGGYAAGAEFATGEFATRLRTALSLINLLGKRIDGNRTMVLCPWRGEHSEGDQKRNQHDTSTVLYETTAGGIVFKCLHAHCTERKAQDVWRWIKDHYPAAIPRRNIPQSHGSQEPGESMPPALEAPPSAPPVAAPPAEVFAHLKQIWDDLPSLSSIDVLPSVRQEYMHTNGFAEAAVAEGWRYKAQDKAGFTAARGTRYRVLGAKQRENPAGMTVEETVELDRLTVEKVASKDDCIVGAYRRPGGQIVSLVFRRLSDEGHANNRSVVVAPSRYGLLGNPGCVQNFPSTFVVDHVDDYLPATGPHTDDGYSVLAVQGPEGYPALLDLDLTGRCVYYVTRGGPDAVRAAARALRAAAHPPAAIIAVGPGEASSVGAALAAEGASLGTLAAAGTPVVADPGTAPAGGPGAPEIVVSCEIHRNVAAALGALARLPGLYQRSGRLVHIVEDNDPGAGVWRARRLPEIVEISEAYLAELLTLAARWFRAKEKKGDVIFEPSMPPSQVVSSIYSRGILPGIRELKFITTTPTLRPDGSIITEAGYDATTGIVYMPSMVFALVPDNPGEADIVDAMRKLWEVIYDFPFKNAAGRSAWLAGLLTRLARFIFDGPTPMFIVDANAPGTGKSRLVNCACLIADGEAAEPLRYSGDPDEDEKRILAMLREGVPVALFDNIDPRKELGHDAIDALLTSTRFKGRILGKTETQACDNFAVWYATGNNVKLAGDTARRTLRIVLRTDEENPEQRDNFLHPELYTWIIRQRPVLVSAALTLIRGWFAAGKPRAPLRALGSFEAWTASIRQIIVWVGDVVGGYGIEVVDPLLANDEDHVGSDEKMMALPALIKGWREMCKDEGVPGLPVSEALEKMRRDGESPGGGPAPNKYRVLRETIHELIPSRGGRDEISPQKLAHLLRMYKNRVCAVQLDGERRSCRFVNGHNGARFWAVEDVTTKPALPMTPKAEAQVHVGAAPEPAVADGEIEF